MALISNYHVVQAVHFSWGGRIQFWSPVLNQVVDYYVSNTGFQNINSPTNGNSTDIRIRKIYQDAALTIPGINPAHGLKVYAIASNSNPGQTIYPFGKAEGSSATGPRVSREVIDNITGIGMINNTENYAWVNLGTTNEANAISGDSGSPTLKFEGGDTVISGIHLAAGTVTLTDGSSADVTIDSDLVFYAAEIAAAIAPEPNLRLSGLGTAISSGDTTPATTDDTDFGNTVVGNPIAHNFSLFNDCTGPLTVSSITSSSTNFVVGTLSANPVVVGATETVPITFSPTGAGTFMATITINSDDADTPAYTFTVTGNATAASVPDIHISGLGNTISSGDSTPAVADDTDYGSVLTTAAAVSHTFTITNNGTGLLNVGTATLSGSTAFSISTAPTATVSASGGTTTIDVDFNPTSSGAQTATLSIPSDDPDTPSYSFDLTGSGFVPQDIAVSGLGNAIPAGDVTPTSVDGTDFGTVMVTGGTPVVRTFTISNSGEVVLTLGTTTIAGSSDFALTTPPSTTSVPISGGTTTFDVTFTPTAPGGTQTATVTIPSDDPDTPSYTFALTGVGGLTPIESWRQTHFAGISDAGAGADTSDPDGDGISNLLEYATDLDPNSPDQSCVLNVELNTGTDKLEATFTRHSDRTDITYEIEGSDDLAAWLPLGTSTFGAPTTAAGTNATTETPSSGTAITVSVEDSTTLSGSTAGRRFLRLSVTR